MINGYGLPPGVVLGHGVRDVSAVNLPEFKKYDAGKLEYDMFPNSVIEDVIKIMMYGAYFKVPKAYGKNNWKLANADSDIVRYYNASRRHVEAWKKGEYNDDESKLPHLAHAICNLVFMHYLEEEKRKKNDANPS